MFELSFDKKQVKLTLIATDAEVKVNRITTCTK
jgi:hypothetical protein